MKERILEFLKKIALRKFSDNEIKLILSPNSLEIEEASQLADKVMTILIHHYNFFQVQTIDSFVNSILSSCAFNIGLSPNFRIQRNVAQYLHLSLDRLIDRALNEKNIMLIFEEFLHQYLFIENRTSWFPKKDILLLLNSLFAQSNMLGADFQENDIDGQKILKIKKEILHLMENLSKNIPEGTDKRFLNSLESFMRNSTYSFDIKNISDYFAREDFPIKNGYDLEESVDKMWTQIHTQLRMLSQLESRMTFNCYIAILKEVLKDLNITVAKEDILFLEELNRKANWLFSEQSITFDELYLRLVTRCHHYLIDEFQDTSALQWENLRPLIEEALSTGGSLFYVGDKKQAIYGFRGGEIALFDQVGEEFRLFNIQIETLSKNYRSHKAIVNFNNRIFSQENIALFINKKEEFESEKKKKDAVVLTLENKEVFFNVFQHAEQQFEPRRNEGYVKVEYLESENKENRNSLAREKFIRLVGSLRSRFRYQDICFLARDNNEVEMITTWLLQDGIPAESERTLNIKENHLIKEIISFLRFLDSPIDNLNFVSFILGDIFGKASGLSPEEMHRFVFRHRARFSGEKDFYIYKEFKESYPAIWNNFIEDFFKNVGLIPLYELIISIMERLDCQKNFQNSQGFLIQFLNLVKKSENDYPDISSFLSFYAELEDESVYIKTSGSEAIKVMTIHKAKGLEFPVVIIPFLEMEISVGKSNQFGENAFIFKSGKDSLELINLKKKYLKFSEELWNFYVTEYLKSFLMELNNLYVALTRAVNEMYLFIPQKAGTSFNLVNFLIPEGLAELGEQVHYPLKTTASEFILQLPSSQYQDWIQVIKEEFVESETLKDRGKILEGELIHSALAQIENLHEQQEAQVISHIIESTENHFPSLKSEDIARLTEILNNVIQKSSLQPFFWVSDGVVFLEKSIVASNGATKRIDRLIIKKNEVWVIDYKSHRITEDLYRQQVREYMKIVQDLYRSFEIKGFLIYLDDLSIEEINLSFNLNLNAV